MKAVHIVIVCFVAVGVAALIAALAIAATITTSDKSDKSDKSDTINDKNKQPMRLLMLVMTSPGYEDMMAITNKYYGAMDTHVDVVFYMFSPTQTEHVSQKGNLITFRGQELFVPGCLDKTLLALQLFAPVFDKYTFIVRPNVSTIVDVRRLMKQLKNRPDIKYAAPEVYTLHEGYNDPAMGITHDASNLTGLSYGQGTCIILSPDTARALLHQEALGHVDHTIVDDVAIGAALAAAQPPVRIQHLGENNNNTLWQVPDFSGDVVALKKDVHKRRHKTVFYRNKNKVSSASGRREVDAAQMATIVEYLLLSEEKLK